MHSRKMVLNSTQAYSRPALPSPPGGLCIPSTAHRHSIGVHYVGGRVGEQGSSFRRLMDTISAVGEGELHDARLGRPRRLPERVARGERDGVDMSDVNK